MKTCTVIVLVVCLFLYLIFGGLIFHLLESTDATDPETADFVKTYGFQDKLTALNLSLEESDLERIEQLLYESAVEGAGTGCPVNKETWDVYNSFFFATTVVSTIGYGHLAPATYAGRVVCCLYALLGIPLFLVATTGVGLRLKAGAHRLTRALACHEAHPLSKLGEYTCSALLIATALGVFIFVPGLVFHLAEGWSYWSGVYYAFITLTTIGFGDLVAGVHVDEQWRSAYRVAISCWVLVGFTWMVSLISALTDVYHSLIGTARAQQGKDAEAAHAPRGADSADNDVADSSGSDVGTSSVRDTSEWVAEQKQLCACNVYTTVTSMSELMDDVAAMATGADDGYITDGSARRGGTSDVVRTRHCSDVSSTNDDDCVSVSTDESNVYNTVTSINQLMDGTTSSSESSIPDTAGRAVTPYQHDVGQEVNVSDDDGDVTVIYCHRIAKNDTLPVELECN